MGRVHPSVQFETHPSRYQHLRLTIEGAVATLSIRIPENGGLAPGYELKLNSYDLGVDIELADAVMRLRFEHPEVGCVVITGDDLGTFSSGANIFMLGSATHGFKVNFCKFTNETRLSIEDATKYSGQMYIAAVNGICSGGGYELALACEKIFLIDDRKSAVALPEVPYLGVLPGTGGLTRLVDKRCVARDKADVFCTLAEGFKGKKAKAWGLVDDVFASSRFKEEIAAQAVALAKGGHADRKGVSLEPLAPVIEEHAISYKYVFLRWGVTPRVAELTIAGPTAEDEMSEPHHRYFLRLFRELDDVLCRLRFNFPTLGLILVKTRGSHEQVLAFDRRLHDAVNSGDGLAREIVLLMKRVLKRMDVTARSFFAVVEEGSCFSGSFYELALACDRIYMLDKQGVSIALSPLNGGPLPMATGLTRLQARFLTTPEHSSALSRASTAFDAQSCDREGLVTLIFDELDWQDEVRLAVEERASLSPDALTGMEASLRFAGPETMESKIFARLSAWQNWIFQRPNAIGERGALSLYGQPESPQFDWERT